MKQRLKFARGREVWRISCRAGWVVWMVFTGAACKEGQTGRSALSVKNTAPVADDSAVHFEQRRAEFLALEWSESELQGEAKYAMPYAILFMEKTGGRHPGAIAYTTEALGRANDKKGSPDGTFGPIGVVQAVYKYPQAFSVEQLARIEADARAIGDWAGGGTENHRLMRWSNAYLLAQRFGGVWEPGRDGSTVPAEVLMTEVKRLLMDEARYRFANGGMSEYLSPNYLAHHVIPLLNLYDFCRDEELRSAAHALLHLHLTHLALNVHDGYILEPHARSGSTQFTGSTVRSANGSQYLSWIYWGSFNPGPERLLYRRDLPAMVYPFSSGFRPHPALDTLANGRGITPFTTRSVGMAWPHSSEVRYPRTTLRSVYRAERFAIGAGYQHHLPAGFYLQHSLFGAAWTSEHEAAFLQCGHNYWFSDQGPRAMWKAPVSPFQQMAHHENTVLMAFNIPREDPWFDAGRSDWIPHRDGHAGKLIEDVSIRFSNEITRRHWNPKLPDGGSLLCLDDGGVFIAIRSLTPARQVSIDESFDGLCSIPRKNGTRSQSAFVFHLATDKEYAGFEAFCGAVATLSVQADWGVGDLPAPVFEVIDPEGDHIVLEYNNSLEPDDQGVVHNLPGVAINGQPLDFDTWPDMEGPGVRLKDGKLQVNGTVYSVNGIEPAGKELK